MMTRTQATHKRDRLAASFSHVSDVLRGSLFERSIHHSEGCAKCARGEGHPLWVLNVGYPGGKTRQISLRPAQVPQAREALEHYRRLKETIEAISELNQQLLRCLSPRPRVRVSGCGPRWRRRIVPIFEAATLRATGAAGVRAVRRA